MNVGITESAEQLTDAKLKEFEKTYDRVIPVPYRKFLLKYNGGRPDPSEFKMRGPRGRGDQVGEVKRFFGINVPEKTLDLGYALETFRERLPKNLFPVARDPGGNLIGITTEGDAAGQILFWDHEREADEGEPPTDRNLYFIADSFDEFLNGLGKVE
jgi:hypothetical protein